MERLDNVPTPSSNSLMSDESYSIWANYIRSLRETGTLAEDPVFPPERFLEKLNKHLKQPYDNDTFTSTSRRYRKHAETITRLLSVDPRIMAVGIAGSLARKDTNFWGWHPKSDADIYLVTKEQVDKDDPEIGDIVYNYAEASGITIDLLAWNLDPDRGATDQTRVFPSLADVSRCIRSMQTDSDFARSGVFSQFLEVVSTHMKADILHVSERHSEDYYRKYDLIMTRSYHNLIKRISS